MLASTVGIIFVFLSSTLPILFIWIYSCNWRRNDLLQQQRRWAAGAGAGEEAQRPSTERPLPALPLVPVGSCGAMAAAAECVICLGEFEGAGAGEDREAMVKVIPGCRHAFHPECIDRWLRSDASCPLCRCTDLAVVAPLPEDRIRGD